MSAGKFHYSAKGAVGGTGRSWSASVELALSVAFALLVANNVVISSEPAVVAFGAAGAVGRFAVIVGVGVLIFAAMWILIRSLSYGLVLVAASVVTGMQVLYVISPHQVGVLPHAWWGTQVVIPVSVLVVGTLPWRLSIPAVAVLFGSYFVVRSLPGTGPGHGGSSALSELSLMVMVSSMIAVIVPLCRRTAVLADRAADRRADADQAADAAGAVERVRRSAGRLLHDEVIHALRAISLPPGAIGDVVLRRLVGTAAALLRREVTGPGPDSGSPLLAIAAAVKQSTIAVDLRVQEEVAVPAQVAEALAGAVGEALRNVHRHAGVDTAIVTVRSSKGAAQVEITDRGRGFNVAGPQADTLGVSSSIIGRITEIGGAVNVSSEEHAGTAVLLTWPAPTAMTNAVTTPAQLLDLANTRSGMLWGICVPQLVFSLVQGVLHHEDVSDPGLAFAGLLLATGTTVGCVRRLIRHPMRASMSFLLAVTAVLAVVAGGWSIRSTMQLDVSYFAAGAGAPAVCLIALFRPIWESLVTAVLVFVAVVTMVLRVEGDWHAIERALPAINASIIAVATVLCVRMMLQAMGRDLWRDVQVQRQTTNLQAQLAVKEKVISERLERVGQWTMPFLAGINDGSLDPHDPQVRQRASVLAAMVRDDIHLGTALGVQARSLVAACREAGGDVQFNAEPDCPDLPGALLTAVIVTALSGPRPEQLILTISPAHRTTTPTTGKPGHAVTVSLFIKPVLHRQALEALSAPLGGTIQLGPNFLLLTVSGAAAMSPEQGTGPGLGSLVKLST